MGPTALPEDFFDFKNPTTSAGFEPANLGTKGQHATPRPPKPNPAIGTNKSKVGGIPFRSL